MSFRLKTILGVALIEAVLLSVLVFSGIRFLSSTAEAEFTQRTQATVKAFSVATKNALIASDLAALAALTTEMLTYPGVVYARVRDATGTVVSQAGNGQALRAPPRVDKDVGDVKDGVFNVAADVTEANTPFGRVELGIASAELQAQKSDARRYGAALAGLEMALVALFSWALGSYLTRQLVALKEGSRALAEGGFGHQLPVRGSDELAQTAEAFNRMSLQLQATYGELQQREADLRRVFNATQDGIFVIDEHGIVLSVNDGGERMFGWSAAELVGHNISTIVPEPHRQAHDGYMRRYLATGVSKIIGVEREFQAQRRDGSELWIALRIAEMDSGSTRRFIGVTHDITERKASETELRRAKVVAEDAANAKSDFLANMSHEIRTPMHGVLGAIEMLADTPLNGQQQRFLGTAKSSAHVLLGVIDEILDFSRLEAGKLRIESLDFDLHHTVEDVTAMLAQRAHAKGIELACFIAPEVPERVRGDPIRLRQILINLVGNAIKFTERGEVVVSASVPPAEGAAPMLRFEVRDTGIGIAKDKQSHLFEPFVQADSSTSRRYGGSGLGLSITRRLVDLMGGQIAFDSIEGSGSRFWFQLPLAASENRPRLPRDGSLAGTRVLVVDDNSTNRVILHRYLTGWSAQSGSAAAGDEALAKLQDAAASGHPYDIALLDMNMPGMDGYELVRAMQGDAVLAQTPVVMLSSSAQSPTRMAGLRVDVWLDKPVRQSDLHDAIVTVLRGREPEPPRDETAAPHAPPHFHGERVLLVEDNLVTRELGTQMLRKRGLSVEVAENGLEAVAAAQSGRFDLVLMDIQMPGMDGYEATAATTIARWLMPPRLHEAPVLDAQRLREVRNIMGEDLGKLLSKAAQSLRAQAAELARAAAEGDATLALDAMHRIKNTAGDVGAQRLGELAARAERALAQGHAPAADHGELQGELQAVVAALHDQITPAPTREP